MTDELTRRLDAARAALNAAEAKTTHTMPVRKCPTRITLVCPRCEHSATIEIMLDQVEKLKCSRCGHHSPVISGRSPLTNWSTKRRAGNAARRGGAP